MNDFGRTKIVKGRKNHRCIACYEIIIKGVPHTHYVGKWSGEFQDWRMHDECYNQMAPEDLEDGFTPGDYPRPALSPPKPDAHLGASEDDKRCQCGCKWVRHLDETGGPCMDCKCGMFEEAECPAAAP